MYCWNEADNGLISMFHMSRHLTVKEAYRDSE